MAARFPSMIGLMRATLKTGTQSCSLPVNSLCLRVLTILRENGFISGFSFDYIRKNNSHGQFHGYPRVRIFFKYSDINLPIITGIKAFRNNRSHFYKRSNLRKSIGWGSNHQHFILTSNKGLYMTSFLPQSAFDKSKKANTLLGKVLVEVNI